MRYTELNQRQVLRMILFLASEGGCLDAALKVAEAILQEHPLEFEPCPEGTDVDSAGNVYSDGLPRPDLIAVKTAELILEGEPS